jgi:catechol 2,3-dioxygenase-like lactoylglutathione lyase family enzyme
MAIGASRIFHVNSNCSDLTRAVSFYRDLLGLRPSTRTVPSASQDGSAFGLAEARWDAWMLQSDLASSGLALDLLEWKVPGPAAAPPTAYNQPGFNRLVFTNPDLAGLLDRLRAEGTTIVGGPVEMDLGNGTSLTMALVLDPDGVPVQLISGKDIRISHVIINSRSLDTSLAYYRDVMGLSVLRETPAVRQPGALYGWDIDTEVRSALLRDPGSKYLVELVEWLDPLPAPDASGLRKANDLGLFRMAWSTDDCARDEAVIRAAGSVPFAPTGELSVGDELPLLEVLFWPGPDGECLELIEVTTRSGKL